MSINILLNYSSFCSQFILKYQKIEASSPPYYTSLRCCGKLTSNRLQARLKNCPGLGLLIVSSVLARSAGCDSCPLSRYLLTTGLGILSSHLPYHRLHHYHYPLPHSHLSVSLNAARMKISPSVSKKRCKLTTSEVFVLGAELQFVGFLIILTKWQTFTLNISDLVKKCKICFVTIVLLQYMLFPCALRKQSSQICTVSKFCWRRWSASS